MHVFPCVPAVRLDEDGYLWEALEEDPSAERESSVPFKLIPYAGGCTHGRCTWCIGGQRGMFGMLPRPCRGMLKGSSWLNVGKAISGSRAGTRMGQA